MGVPPTRASIPRVVHFVYGFRPQHEPFHVLHHVAIESCRRVVQPDEIVVHCKELPWGAYWDLTRPHVTLRRVEAVDAVRHADYSEGRVPARYRYAHHADFVRLDALLATGGIYADIDTVFLRPLPDELFDAPFVIGREGAVADERSGALRPSLCNALLMARPQSPFAATWRDRMADELDGTWSNHSGFLAEALARERPDDVVIVPERLFFPVPCTVDGLRSLLEVDDVDDEGACSVHLWAHLWWDRARRDFSSVHAGQLTAARLRDEPTALGRFVRPYLPEVEVW